MPTFLSITATLFDKPRMILLLSYHNIVCYRCMNMYQTETIQFTGRRFPRVLMRIWTKTSSFSRISNWEFLDLEIDSKGRLRMKLYDKRDYFNVPIVNFPFICSNLASIACIWSIHLSVDPIFQSLWFLAGFPG